MSDDMTEARPQRGRREPKQLTEVQSLMRIEQLLDALPKDAQHRLGTYLWDRYAPPLVPMLPPARSPL